MSAEPTLADLLDELVQESRDLENYAYWNRDALNEKITRSEIERLKAEIISCLADSARVDALVQHLCTNATATFTVLENEMVEMLEISEIVADEGDESGGTPMMFDTVRDILDALAQSQSFTEEVENAE